MFHGNGGNLGHRIPLAAIFVKKMRCNVLMMCYRGCVYAIILSHVLIPIPLPKAMVIQRALLRKKVCVYTCVVYATSDYSIKACR